jgi:putative transposase
MNLAPPLSLPRMCEWNAISRAGFYRWSHAPEPADRDLDRRDEIRRIALAMPCYGWRRIPAELRRHGWPVNHKRVQRLMRDDNRLCLRRRKFLVTTDSNPEHPVYPDGAADLALTGINQLWVADITYIRLESEFVYWAVILDAFSRRVLGWALDRSLEAALVITALRRARAERQPVAGLVHHSDRGGAIRLWRLYGAPAGSRHHDQYEPERKSLRQCRLRVVYENVEI